ncbi:hypothetical protein JCM10207_006601 [Rhodosporidiobolus poonsookiae]
MASAAAAQQQLLQLLGTLPADANPYLAIQDYLKAQLYPAIPESAVAQLWFLAAVLAITALLVAVSLGIRLRQGSFWLFRMHDSTAMIRPHATVSWSLVAFVMLVFFEILIWREVQFIHKNIVPTFAYWMFLVWGLAWLGGHTAAWSLAASYLLHLHSSSTSFPTRRAVPLVNAFGIALPVCYAAALLSLGIIGGGHYSAALHRYQDLEGLLQTSASTWTEGATFSVFSLAPALPVLEELQSEMNSFLRWFRIVFAYYAATAMLLVIYLVTVAALHLTSLRKTLKQTSLGLSSNEKDASTRRQSRQQARVDRTLQSLMLTIGAFSFLGFFFTIVAIVAAAQPSALVTSPAQAQFVLHGPFWAFAVFGLPCAVLLVLRARDATASAGRGERNSSRSRSNGKNGSDPTSGAGARAKGAIGEEGDGARTQLGLSRLSFGGRTEDESLVMGEERTSRVSFGGRGHGHSRRGSRYEDVRWDQSVSITVDVDVEVEEGEVDAAEEKRESFPRSATSVV